jgi:hypothetical protein
MIGRSFRFLVTLNLLFKDSDSKDHAEAVGEAEVGQYQFGPLSVGAHKNGAETGSQEPVKKI